jgi:anti-sigma factor RsiW
MTCEEIQKTLSSYLDDQVSPEERAICQAHLVRCPLCRAHLAATRALVRSLTLLPHIEPPADLAPSISAALAIEAAARQRQPVLPLHVKVMQWLRPRIMPYAVGAFASLLLFFALASALRPYVAALREWEAAARPGPNGHGMYDEFYSLSDPISLESYAASRNPFTDISPSLNPHGALANLTRTPSRGRAADDEMIIVANVFSNGSASLADIVVPPRNRHMLDEVQKALRESPAFVPAALDRRPQTMRVVFSFQKVDVREQSF